MRRFEGSIIKIKDGYRVFAPVVNGKRKSKVVHGTRKQAEQALRELVGEPSDTFGNALDRYIIHLESREKAGDLAASTVREYKRLINCNLSELRSIPVAWIRVERIRALLDSLPKNRRAVHKMLRQVFNWLEKNGEIDSNPIRRLERPTSSRLMNRDDIYTAEEVNEILSALGSESKAFQVAVLVALGCGLRRGEICGLLWSDYDGKRIKVTKAYEKDKPKTLSSIRTVSVPASIAEKLNDLKSAGRMVPLAPDTVTQSWERFVKKNGFRKLPFKNLRHTSLTMVYEATGDIYATSRRAGHASIGITTKYYARPDQSIDDKAAQSLDDLIG